MGFLSDWSLLIDWANIAFKHTPTDCLSGVCSVNGLHPLIIDQIIVCYFFIDRIWWRRSEMAKSRTEWTFYRYVLQHQQWGLCGHGGVLFILDPESLGPALCCGKSLFQHVWVRFSLSALKILKITLGIQFGQEQWICSVTLSGNEVLCWSSICDLKTLVNCCFTLKHCAACVTFPLDVCSFHSASQRTWHFALCCCSAMLCLPSWQVWCCLSWWMCPAGVLFSLMADASTNATAS